MKLLIKVVREGLGRLIVFMDWVFSPRRLKRPSNRQIEIDEQTKRLKLYQFYACPFCIKTRRHIKRLNLNIEARSAQSGQYRTELLASGGEIKVPCLRIEEDGSITWMYESADIIAYLEQRFG